MDKKKKINYFADYKLKLISQLFLSNRRMHCAVLLYILCFSVITYHIWGIFYFSTGGPCTSICHLSILLWLCCGLWSHTQWPLPWSTVTYAATSFFFDIHVAFLGFRCLVWFGVSYHDRHGWCYVNAHVHGVVKYVGRMHPWLEIYHSQSVCSFLIWRVVHKRLKKGGIASYLCSCPS